MKPRRGLHAFWGTLLVHTQRGKPFPSTVRLVAWSSTRYYWPGYPVVVRELLARSALGAPRPGRLRPRTPAFQE